MQVGGRNMVADRKRLGPAVWKKKQARHSRMYEKIFKTKSGAPAEQRDPTVNYYCSKCKAHTDRKMEPDERELFWRHDHDEDIRRKEMFRPYHDFLKVFHDKDESWKWTGWDLIERIERWMKKWPGRVENYRCDDSYHASSDIYVFHHELRDYYWGTTFVYVPQCSGDPPAEWFFYDNHAKAFLKLLKSVVGKHKEKGDDKL